MKPPAPLSPDDEDLLYAVLDRALERLEDGHPADVDALLGQRTDLRDAAQRMVRLAARVSTSPPPELPSVRGYEVVSELGRGGMGAVYLARQQQVGGRLVALKVLDSAGRLSPRARERFTAEALAIGRLKHPHIVAIYDVVRDRDCLAYAMEWIEGQTLAAWIAQQQPASMDIAFVARLGAAIARALAAVHKAGLLHRDVKPGNILIRSDPAAPGPLLSDFGLAREADSTLTEAGNFAGTVWYAPPEQLRGESALDVRSDIYALGVTLYHALALAAPYQASNPVHMLRLIEGGLARPLRQINSRVPRDLETIVAKAMEPDPVRRYPSAAEFADDLQRVLSFQPIRARRAGLVARTAKFARRNRGALIAGGIASVLTLMLAGAALTYALMAPRIAARHLREARLALLDPAQATDIVSDLYWGYHINASQSEVAHREHALAEALRAYDAALGWWPFDGETATERAVIAAVHRGTAPPNDELRSLGLYAFLQRDYAKALKTWQTWEDQRDPLLVHDPLVDAALGVLHLFREQPGRAYPRLLRAVDAFPDVSFLRADLAEAALKTGDLDRAQKWLQIAETLPRPHPGGLGRIRAALLAAQGHFSEADQAYRALLPEGPCLLDYARFLEARGRTEDALTRYARVAAYGGEISRAAYQAALERWWIAQREEDRLRLMKAALSSPRGAENVFLERLRLYVSSEGPAFSNSGEKNGLSAEIVDFFRSPSLERLSLSDMAHRMEVENMVLWNQLSRSTPAAKQWQLATWRWPFLRAFSVLASIVSTHLAVQPAAAQCNQPPCFQGLGDLPGGPAFSQVDDGGALSADGTTIVGFSKSTNGTEAFRWRAEMGMVGLGVAPGDSFFSTAFGVSADGSYVAGITDSSNVTCGGREAFRWSQNSGLVPLDDSPGACFWSIGAGISADGSVVCGESYTSAGYQASYWTAGTWVAIAPSPSSFAACSADGTRMGGTLGNVAIYFSPQTGLLDLGDLAGGNDDAYVYDLTDDGLTMVGRGSTDAGRQAFRWTSSTGFTVLSDLPGGAVFAAAFGVSGDGSLIVGEGTSSIGLEAVMWDQQLVVTRIADVLAARGVSVPTGWTLTHAAGVRANGNVVTICGFGVSPGGNTEAWIARYALPAPPCFQGLGDLPGGDFFSGATDLSSDGTTVVGLSQSDRNNEPFRWRADSGMTPLRTLAGADVDAFDDVSCSGDGEVVALTAATTTLFRGYRWTAQDGLTPLVDFPDGPDGSAGLGISDDGSTIVGFGDAVGGCFAGTPARWDVTGAISELPNAFEYGGARAASSDGSVVVGFGTPCTVNLPRPIRWAGGVAQLLGSVSGIARDVSADGNVVVGTRFRWTPESGQTSLSGNAYAVSSDGSIAGGTDVSGEGAIWRDGVTAERVTDVLAANGVTIPSGWVLESVEGVAINGAVVSLCGTGLNPNGDYEAWIARYSLAQPPCPGERGDANCDSTIDFFDIDPFLQALFDPPGYASAFCGGPTCAVDVDCSGTVDFFDIDAFLSCLFTACPPCP